MHILSLISFLILSSAAFAQPYQNTLGQLKYDFLNLIANYDRYAYGCLMDSRSCGLSSSEVSTMRAIFENHSEEHRRTKYHLISGRDNPEIFRIGGGSPRIAVTGSNRFDPVYFNIDLLTDPRSGHIKPMDQLISIMIHEMGHHEGIGDTQERTLDRIGNAAGDFFRKTSTRIDLAHMNLPHISAFIQNMTDFEGLKRIPHKRLRFAQAGWAFGNGTIHFHDHLPDEIARRVGGACSRPDYVQAYHFGNLRWLNLPSSIAAGVKFNLIARMKILCGPSLQRSSVKEASLLAFAEIHRINGQWILKEGAHGWNVITEDGHETKLSGTVDSISTNSKTMSAGGDWTGKAVISTSQDLRVRKCFVSYTADHFYKYVAGFSYPALTDECRFRKISEAKYEIIFRHRFSSKTRPAEYRIENIELLHESQAALMTKPVFRTSVQVRNLSWKQPKVMMQGMFDESGYQRSASGIDRFRPGDKFSFQLSIQNLSKPANFIFYVKGVQKSGEMFHSFVRLYRKTPGDDPNIIAHTGKDDLGTVLMVEWRPQVEVMRNLRSYSLDYIDIIDIDNNVIRHHFPTSFQVRP